MIFITLFFSAILLGCALAAVSYWQAPLTGFVLCYGLFAFFPIFILLALPPVMLQGALLLVVIAFCCYPVRRPKAAIIFGLGATLLAYAVIGFFAWQPIAELRAQYPLVSLESRVPAPRQTSASPLTEQVLAELSDYETAISDDGHERRRLNGLRLLHESTFETFISRPGFGATRMYDPLAWISRPDETDNTPVRQPVAPSMDWLSTQSLQENVKLSPPERPNGSFRGMIQSSFLDFVNPAGFGYVRDRRHVAGFEPHRFRKVPPAPALHEVNTVELVGFVVHPEPVVYVSKNLPNMNELAAAPKRPLDKFERDGHAALLAGETIFARNSGDQTRVLGAVRAIQQCTACHACERGHLLGAFSYTLQR